jgi:CDP-glycerol glycerophosphotransferase (TagB/SpsB family)
MFQFQEYVTSHRARSVISLHGNPDKYRDLYWLEKLVDEDLVLVYGPQLHADLLEKNIGKEPLFSGNYRAAFYQENLSFFTATLPFVKTKPLVLYAPTWAAKEVSSPLKKHYTPFFSVCHALFESLGEEYQLIVKLHPLLIQSMLDEVESIKERYPHLYFLDDFPLIYPILEQVDFYIGDYSSIGYDFLFFDRPLFFIEPSVQTPLHRYGRVISREELYSFPEEGEHASRQEAYHYAFGEKKGRRVLQQEIREAMCDDRRSHRSVANR